MANLIAFDPRLDSGWLSSNPRLRGILEAAFSKKITSPSDKNILFHKFWNADHFGLQKVDLFNESTRDEKREILGRCIKELMLEAHFIEKAGLGFNAKMVLLSESTDERLLYSLFAGEEATHFQLISAYLPASAPQSTSDPFIRLVSEMIADGNKPSLTYLVQIVLEGWGLNHYRSMAHDCQNAALRKTLLTILKDEALHHGSGVALFDKQKMSPQDVSFILDVLVRLFKMVQQGPQRVVQAIEEVKGHLSKEQRRRIFEQLDCEADINIRQTNLYGILRGNNFDALLPTLERHGVLRPMNAKECADVRV